MSFCSGSRKCDLASCRTRPERPPPAPTPQAPPAASQAPGGSSAAASSAPAETAVPFPPVDPANFLLPTPTKPTVEEFLKAYWGYDTSRTWQVQAIQPTPAPGVSRVIVLVKGTGGGPKEQTGAARFLHPARR